MLFQISPQFRRQIRQFIGNLEIVHASARFFYSDRRETLALHGSELRLRMVVAVSSLKRLEQIAFHRVGCINRFFLQLARHRHDLTSHMEHRCGNH